MRHVLHMQAVHDGWLRGLLREAEQDEGGRERAVAEREVAGVKLERHLGTLLSGVPEATLWRPGFEGPASLEVRTLVRPRGARPMNKPTFLASVTLVALNALGGHPASMPRAAGLRPRQDEVASLVERMTPFVATIIVQSSAGETVSTGTGVLVEGGRVVTNYHVVEGGRRVQAQFVDGLIVELDRVIASSKEADLAVLSSPALSRLAEPSVVRLTSRRPSPGTRVVVIGSPYGLGGTVTEGLVSSIREVEGRTLLQLSASVSHGSSGSPVFDYNGKAVGVIVSKIGEGEGLSFAVPSSSILDLLEHATEEKKYSEWAGGSDQVPSSAAFLEAKQAVVDILTAGLAEMKRSVESRGGNNPERQSWEERTYSRGKSALEDLAASSGVPVASLWQRKGWPYVWRPEEALWNLNTSVNPASRQEVQQKVWEAARAQPDDLRLWRLLLFLAHWEDPFSEERQYVARYILAKSAPGSVDQYVYYQSCDYPPEAVYKSDDPFMKKIWQGAFAFNHNDNVLSACEALRVSDSRWKYMPGYYALLSKAYEGRGDAAVLRALVEGRKWSEWTEADHRVFEQSRVAFPGRGGLLLADREAGIDDYRRALDAEEEGLRLKALRDDALADEDDVWLWDSESLSEWRAATLKCYIGDVAGGVQLARQLGAASQKECMETVTASMRRVEQTKDDVLYVEIVLSEWARMMRDKVQSVRYCLQAGDAGAASEAMQSVEARYKELKGWLSSREQTRPDVIEEVASIDAEMQALREWCTTIE